MAVRFALAAVLAVALHGAPVGGVAAAAGGSAGGGVSAAGAPTLDVAADETLLVLRCGTLIDGNGGEPVKNAVVVIEGETIVSVEQDHELEGGHPRAGSARTSTAPDARVVDLTSHTCMPGLIDAHAHVLIATDDYQIDHLRRSSGYKALRALRVLKDMLDAGWTSVRIAGDADVYYAHLDARTAIEEGLFVGPRVTGAGHYISMTGGGGDLNFFAPEHDVVSDGLVVDGVEAIRRAVRNEVKYGSDWIKVLASGAMMSAGDDPMRVHFSPEEMRALVEEADRLGVPVMAHAHATEAIKQAIRAGVRSIEHGSFLDEEGIQLLLEHDVFLVPTMYVGDYYLDEHPDSEAQREFIELSRRSRADNHRRMAAALRAGVKIGVGTDYVGFPIPYAVRELATLVEVGMTPMEAIVAATRTNAELLGQSDRLGTVEPGKLADLIAVPGDPLTDMSTLESVSLVMLGGEVIRDDR